MINFRLTYKMYVLAGGKPRAVADVKQLNYSSFGAAVSEVEIDVLTGEKLILRSDILFDCGRSFNPAVDLGQVIHSKLSLAMHALWPSHTRTVSSHHNSTNLSVQQQHGVLRQFHGRKVSGVSRQSDARGVQMHVLQAWRHCGLCISPLRWHILSWYIDVVPLATYEWLPLASSIITVCFCARLKGHSSWVWG